MKNKQRIAVAAAAAYLLIGIATFGNALVFFERKGRDDVRYCQEINPANDFCGMYKSTGTAAAFSVPLWPFYWSYRMAQ